MAEMGLLPLAHPVQKASFHIAGGVGVRRREPAMPRQRVRDDPPKARRRTRSASHGAAVRAAGGPARTGLTIAKRNARENHCALADLAATRGPAKQSADVATVTGAVRVAVARADVMDSAAAVATPAPRRVEQKLYTLESMVDRGFEDVPDEAEDSGNRRVHWTIVKRTVADQKSGKPMSATYVLQREGGETEFPNLGAARAAANKTIVHPEKLTMSKAEHAAAKNSK